MSAAENTKLLQNAYAEVSNGNVGPLLESLADDIQWTIIGSTPLSGVFHGRKDVIEKLLTPLGARLSESVVFTPERFIAEGDHVVMLARGKAVAKTGRPYNNTYCIVARIVDGKIRGMTDYVDTELITSALFD